MPANVMHAETYAQVTGLRQAGSATEEGFESLRPHPCLIRADQAKRSVERPSITLASAVRPQESSVRRKVRRLIERYPNSLEIGVEQIRVHVEGHRPRRVTEHSLEGLDVRPGETASDAAVWRL